MNYKATLLIVLLAIIYGCGPKPMQNKNANTYLALGDSYSIGEKVKVSERWPVQLAQELNKNGHKVANPKIIAKTGWTTGNLLQAMEENLQSDEKYDLVSVLIGVNNQYQKKSIEAYKKDLNTIFKMAIDHCSQGKKGVFVLSIPDYGVTPFGMAKGKNWDISEEVANFNAACKGVAEKFGIPFYNITPISKYAKVDSKLTAEDNLHPSGLMYTLWVSEILEEVENQI